MKINVKSDHGFTLVELLASIIVLVAVGSIIVGIISSSLRGSGKTSVMEAMKQSGSHILNQIVKDITYAQAFDGTSTGFNTAPRSISCPPPLETLTDITVRPSSDIVTRYSCISGPDLRVGLNGGADNSLIDANAIFSLQSCSFSCTQVDGVPVIKISFTLEPKGEDSLVEKSSKPMTFETSVTMRNYKKSN